MVSGPFTANKKWLSMKWGELAWRELKQIETWEASYWPKLDKLLEMYQPYQIFAAMLEYFKECRLEGKQASFPYQFVQWAIMNMPTERMAKVMCLQKHFPNDEPLRRAYHDIRTFEEAWFPNGFVVSEVLLADELIDKYMRKVV